MALCVALAALLSDGGVTAPELDQGAGLAMFASAILTGLCGAVLWGWSRNEERRNLGRREATLVVAVIWVGAGVFGGIPFIFDAGFTPIDAFFEAVSGFTTTG